MKAAVVFNKGEMPKYTEDFKEPIAESADEVLITVKAAAVKHLDKARASGKHYSTRHEAQEPRVPGMDGVGVLKDGTRVFAFGKTGMLAEKAIANKNSLVKLPDDIDDITAAALPNAVAGSAMALRYKAALKAGETVLINGATSFTGKIAIQIAKHYGAKRIIVTGRNEDVLQSLKHLGAETVLSLAQDESQFILQLKELHYSTPIDVIIDYLWGRPAELILEALKGKGTFTHKTRFVSIGAVANDKIRLSAEALRSMDLQLCGSGLGSWTQQEMQQLFTDIIPEMLRLAATGQLKADTISYPLKEIEKIWQTDIPGGKRLVVTM